MQGDDGVAALNGGELLRVVAAFVVGLLIPLVAFAGLVRPFGFEHIVDGEMQGDDGVAALNGGKLLRVVARSIVCGAIPLVAFAGLMRPIRVDDVQT